MGKMWPKNPERGANTSGSHDRGLRKPAAGPDMTSTTAPKPQRPPDKPVTFADGLGKAIDPAPMRRGPDSAQSV